MVRRARRETGCRNSTSDRLAGCMVSTGRVVSTSLLGLTLVLAGCRLQISAISDGSGWTRADYRAVQVGETNRDGLLARLGPPDRLRYTLREEIHEYQIGDHRGTDLVFISPTQGIPGIAIISRIRAIVAFLFPARLESSDFQDDFTIRFASSLTSALFSFVPLGTQDSFSLHNRALRYDVARFVLDRKTRVVRSKSLFLGIGDYREEAGLVDRTFLIDEE